MGAGLRVRRRPGGRGRVSYGGEPKRADNMNQRRPGALGASRPAADGEVGRPLPVRTGPPHPRPRRPLSPAVRGAVAVVAAAAVVAAGVWVAGFVRTGEARLATLPTRVRAQLQRENSVFVPLRDVPPALASATISVEDQTFWTNAGVSVEGTARALLVDLTTLSFAQGGSTITQQLVRDQLLGFQKTLGRKLTGTAYSLMLAHMLPKRTVLALYLNEVTYGPGVYGVAAAARHYFGVAPRELSLAQCALLAGLPQDPAGLDPFRHPRAARLRQAEVLNAMVQTGNLSPSAARAAKQAPWGLAKNTGLSGSAHG
jgi:membrane peptidoglycan carboxypeptidase